MKKVKVETSGMVREVELEEISVSGIKQFIQKGYSRYHKEMILNADSITSNGDDFFGNLFYTVHGKFGSLIQMFSVSYSKLLNTISISSIYINNYDLEELSKIRLTA